MATESRVPYIKYNWVSDDARLLNRASELTVQYLSGYSRKPNKDFHQAFVVVLTSLQVLTGFKPNAEIMIPLDRNLYSGNTRRNLTYTNDIHKCLSWMTSEKQGYLVKTGGVSFARDKQGRTTTWLPSNYLISKTLADGPIASHKSIYRNPLLGYVELREEVIRQGKKAKQSMPIPDDQAELHSDAIASTEATLAAYYSMMKQVDIKLGSTPLFPAMISMVRIFSRGDMRLGGRLYSPIQNLKSEARKYLSFDGDPVFEIDYAAIHPSMLYHQKNISLSYDPYTIDGFRRSDVKLAFNIMINRSGGNSAANTVARELDCPVDDAKALEEAVLNRHSAISEHFNSDAGLRLQRLDSEITLSILKTFVANKRPIITIHDSAVVSVRDTEELKLAMESAYADVVKNRFNDAMTMNAIKVDSLEFTPCLDALIVASLNGTLEGDDYADDTWDKSISKNAGTQCPSDLHSYQYLENADDC